MIEFRDVSLTYPSGVEALKTINLAIKEGEFVYVMGQTGSGKSTLLQLLFKELNPTEGRITLNGKDLATIKESRVPEYRRRVGFVPQDILLLPNKRVWENLTYAMRAVGHSRREVRRVVPQILERFDLLHRAGAFPSQLSGGEQQRVAIARAIINEPVLVLADEPTGHLDPDMSKSILQDFVEINKRGTTVVMATHDMATMQEFPARTITLEKGMIVADESHTQESTR